MYILVNKTNPSKQVDTVFYAADELHYFDENTLLIDGSNIFIEQGTYEVVEVNGVPQFYQPNKFKYIAETGVFEYLSIDDYFQDQWSVVRQYRNSLLEKSDTDSGILWYDRWNAKTGEEKTKWTEYRQELRDITTNFTTLDSIIWPQDPSTIQEEAPVESTEPPAPEVPSNPTE